MKTPDFRRGVAGMKPDVRPTDCRACLIHVDTATFAEAKMILMREGPGSAQAFFDEKLEDVHAGH